MNREQLGEAERATLVERQECPRCSVPPGSPCRTRTGTVATAYHSVRYDTVPVLRSGPPIRVPKDRQPGKAWRVIPQPDVQSAAVERPGDRIGYGRVSGHGQDLETQERLLRAAQCIEPLYVETISTRQPTRPQFQAALAALRPNDILTVTMLDRLGRDTLELITSAQDIEHRGNRLEILQGPLAGVYDPRGPGKLVFTVFAAFAEVEREFIRGRSLDGLATAEANGRYGGRPRSVDADALAVALARRKRTPPQSVTAIARDLGVGRSTLYRVLAEHEEQPS
ncbi:recombinase family protein (plasmid) [Streptomyces europaeiscabiei]|uniref:recombinase family protein n=1 Tax=Streptomyces europaeiscabiei TaxID=146819 RepID=UPI002E814AB0|nr:recombinase family protein [Streptomyces europaeiscabiei]WUD38795.1 recombinase family protein [Streptomyces europaeiscabiei]